VQVDMNTDYSASYPLSWSPFVTSINMNGTNGAGDCTAYIAKLAYFAANFSPGKLIISASAGGYGNTDWYFDGPQTPGAPQTYAKEGVTNVDPTASVTSSTGYYFGAIITAATNVAGYFTAGWDGTGQANMFVGPPGGTNIQFSGNSGWYIMSTIDSFSGQRSTFQAGFLSWFTTNSFGGTNYSNTPVGGLTYVDEPSSGQLFDRSAYYGDWAAGKSFAISAWACQHQNLSVIKFQAVGDPFVKK